MDTTAPIRLPAAHLHSSLYSLSPSTDSLAVSTDKIKQGESCRDEKEQPDFKVVLAEERCRERRCFNLPSLALLACTKTIIAPKQMVPLCSTTAAQCMGQRQQSLSTEGLHVRSREKC